MFDHMVPAHIARRVGWNHGFDTFNPAVDLSAGPLILQSVSADGQRRAGPEPQVVGDTVGAGHGHGRTWPPTRPTWTGVLAADNQAVAQPDDFDLNSLDAVSSLPNTQSTVKPSLNLLQLEFNVTSPVTSTRPVAAGHRPCHRPHRAPGTDLRAHRPRRWCVNQDHLATASQSSYNAVVGGGRVRTPDPTCHRPAAAEHRLPQGPDRAYVDAAGKQLTLRMAVESGDPWIDRWRPQIAAQLQAGRASPW